MNRASIIALRVFIVLLVPVTLLGQVVVIPSFARSTAQIFPEVDYLALPYSIAAIAAVGCVQVAFLAVWMLLAMVSRRAIFTERAVRWVDVIIAAALIATMVSLGIGLHLAFVVQAGGPAIVGAFGAALIGGVAFVPLMIVMRGLLRTATTLENELAEVV